MSNEENQPQVNGTKQADSNSVLATDARRRDHSRNDMDNRNTSDEVINETGQKDETTGVDDTQQHDNSDPDTAGLTRPDDNSRVGDGVVDKKVIGASKADGGLSDRSARLSAQNRPKLSAQPQPANPFGAIPYEKTKWKRSRIKKGQLIKRLTGYSIAETEYGVSYLWVLSRKPDRTSADNSVHGMAGYYNWKALAESGLLRKEKKAR